MVKSLEQAIAELERLPPEDQEQIGRSLLSHVEKLRALRAEIDKGIASLDAGLGKESSVEEFSAAEESVNASYPAHCRVVARSNR